MTDMMQPPYPPDCRAKGYRFEIDYERINQSDTWALASPEQRPWLVMLWLIAWQQTPCGTLPSDDQLIAARLGMSLPMFFANKDVLLRNWLKHSDERLYHPTITELVREKIARRDRETQRKAAYREKMKSQTVPCDTNGTDRGQGQDSAGSDDTGTGTGTGKSKPIRSPSASVFVDDGFASFWENFPRKAAKQDAMKAWRKLKPTGQPLADLMAGLELQKSSEQWRKDSGKYVPYAATWLNGRRWEDELPTASEQADPDSRNSVFAGAV